MFKLSDYTDEQIQAARCAAAQKELACASHCMNDDFGFADHVTIADKIVYQQKQIDSAIDTIAGNSDHNFTIHQRMEYYLTGVSTPLLSKEDKQ